ncbi:hypothetical protein NUU61_002368 [Penicillium alfredii]|uniref:Uncharacterized protein n=1 Tax=Penicillium alfredii TaxID=1506179 RepID=A0A9W9FRC6_9EURO|nr:uncharacterized protein NUU61_002368 [Penicillium alfredii]KAJ5105021.1 hypothetical protein NUU61_002368 [Penicillium alfredii]
MATLLWHCCCAFLLAIAIIKEMATPSASTLATGERFYIYLSSEKNKKDPYLEVGDGTNSETFISKLPDKTIILTGPPAPTAATELHDEDKWVEWLKKIDDAAKYTLTIMPPKEKEGKESGKGEEDNKKTELKQFDFAFNTPTKLNFSSESSVLNNTFGDAAKNIEEPGFHNPRLYLGLKASDKTEVPLAKVWTWTGKAEDSIPDILKGLQVTPDSKLAPGHRNALWFNPEASSRVTVRLVFNLGDLGTLNSLGLGDLDISFTQADLVCRKVVSAGEAEGKTVPVTHGKTAISIDCNFGQYLELQGIMEFTEDAIGMSLLAKSKDPIPGALSWLTGVLGLKEGELGPLPKLFSQDPFKDVRFRRINVVVGTKPKVKLASFKLDVQVSAPIGQDPASGNKTLFLLSYTYIPSTGGLGTIQGKLWEDENPTLDPTYETWTDLEPIPAGTPLLPLQIKYLIPGYTIDNIPKTIPDTIERLFLTLNTEGVWFGAMVKAKAVPPGNVPQPNLGVIEVNASFKWGLSDFKLDLYAEAFIVPPASSTHKDPALLTGKLTYERTKASS